MRTRRRLLAGTLAAAAAVGGLALSAAGGASPPSSLDFTPVSSANPKAPGVAAPNILSQELGENVVAQGSWKLENGTAAVPYYGYDGNGPLLPQLAAPNVEASKTEPDKNTYLAFRSGLPGADPSYGYGRHFLFQGHETGTTGYITRINLDADGEHRVTLLATNDVSGKALPTFDGSTWEPWAHRLLFTAEGSQGGGVWASDLQAPANVVSLTGSIGQGGYEGIQDDSDGNIWIVEDSGGANKPDPNDPTKTVPARRPNSFVYRYVPDKPGDLANGELQALQVLRADGTPITFASQAPLASPDQVALHTYGNVFHTRWVTIHDTSVDGNAPYNANTLAKAVQATPFKRPENGLFRPGSHFTAFYFDETGDTNATSPENDCCAGWTAIMKLTQRDPSAETGRLTLFYEETTSGSSRTRATRSTRSGTHSTRPSCSICASTTRRACSPFGSSPRGATPPRRSIPVSQARRGSRTRATTRSPAFTSPTATRRRMGSSAPRARTRLTTRATGARSGPSNTATTSPTSCCGWAASKTRWQGCEGPASRTGPSLVISRPGARGGSHRARLLSTTLPDGTGWTALRTPNVRSAGG
jgi:hypothetical protein